MDDRGTRRVPADDHRLHAAVRAIEVGMDVGRGDGVADIDLVADLFASVPQGSMLGTLFSALEPNVRAGVAAFPTGLIPEHLRWQIGRRPEIGTAPQNRTPSLLQQCQWPDLIDGVPVPLPFFNEKSGAARPADRDQRRLQARFEIQQALEFSEMVSKQACHQRYGRATYG